MQYYLHSTTPYQCNRVAERVSDEMCAVGTGLVGYQIRLERRVCDKLDYCSTNGILLRRLQVDPTLIGVSHIVLDEVHERNMESDFLLIVLRDLLRVRKDLRIVLMSATLNADTFATYFRNSVSTVNDVPKVHIPGFTYPVEDNFLEDALEWTSFDLTQEPQNGGIGKKNNRGGAEEVGERDALFQAVKFLHRKGSITSSIPRKQKVTKIRILKVVAKSWMKTSLIWTRKRSLEERKNCFSSSCA